MFFSWLGMVNCYTASVSLFVASYGLYFLQSRQEFGMPMTLDDLRRFAVARSLFSPTTLKRALDLLGFVQADPIRAPARAQDLILRHRVKNYRAGELERRYADLGIEEDFFITYGFVSKSIHTLMHPRSTVGVPAKVLDPGPQHANSAQDSF